MAVWFFCSCRLCLNFFCVLHSRLFTVFQFDALLIRNSPDLLGNIWDSFLCNLEFVDSTLMSWFEMDQALDYTELEWITLILHFQTVCYLQIWDNSLGPLHSLNAITKLRLYEASCCTGYTIDLYLVGTWFESQLGTLAILAEVFLGFSPVSPGKYEASTLFRLWLLPSESFLVHCTLTILPFVTDSIVK
jgi:hypothetical protein